MASNGILSVDTESIINALSNKNFDYEIITGTYSDEWLTLSYIESVANAIKEIKDSWNSIKESALSYANITDSIVRTAISILPEVIPYVSNYLNANVNENYNIQNNELKEKNNNIQKASIKTKGGNLNVRSGMGTDTNIVGSLDNNKEVIIGETRDGWTEILNEDGSRLGYVSSKYVIKQEINNQNLDDIVTPIEGEIKNTVNNQQATVNRQESITETPNRGIQTINSNKAIVKVSKGKSLNIRSGPGTSSNILGKISNGEEVNIVSTDGKWTKILYNGRSGYVYSEYLGN